MCQGISIFVNNKKAIYAKKTNSHDEGAKLLKIDRDNYRAFEWYWWKDELVSCHNYDEEALKVVEKINEKKAIQLAEALVAKEFNTPFKIYKWLKDVPGEWQTLKDVKDKKLKEYLFKKITGYTPEENRKALIKAKKRANKEIARIKKIKWFNPKPELKKRDIRLTVKACLNLFKLPRVEISFKWLETSDDWDAARDAAWAVAWAAAGDAAGGAARDAAWDAAGDAAWAAARDAAGDAAGAAAVAGDAACAVAGAAAWAVAWAAAGDAAWDAARAAAGEIAADLKEYKKKYPEVPFKKLIDLWEMGLYPIGVVKGKFLIYVPRKNKKGQKVKLV